NVGSMAHSTGKVQPNRTLAFNQDDIDTFNKLFEHGLTFDVRNVPGDSGENMQTILERAQNELNSNASNQSKGGKIMELTVIQIILVLFVAFLAGVEGILDEFHFHQPVVACTLIGLVTGELVPCIILGGTLQFIALAWANIGAAVAPDAAL